MEEGTSAAAILKWYRRFHNTHKTQLLAFVCALPGSRTIIYHCLRASAHIIAAHVVTGTTVHEACSLAYWRHAAAAALTAVGWPSDKH